MLALLALARFQWETAKKKMIKDIKKGEIINTFNLEKKKVEKSEIKSVIQSKSNAFCKINFGGDKDEIICKPNHLFYSVKDCKWKAVIPNSDLKLSNLTKEDCLMGMDLKPKKIVDICCIKVSDQYIVYNLHVEKNHNFFVNNVLAHNMQIYVEIDEKKYITLDIEPSEHIGNIIAKIQEKEGLNPPQLIFMGTVLENGRTLSDYNIKNMDTLTTQMNIQIMGNTLTWKTLNLNVYSSNSIYHVKERVKEKEGISIDQQRLFLAGMELIDERSLLFYQIKDNTTLHMNQIFINRKKIHIFVQGFTKEKIILDVEPCDYIHNIRTQIQGKEGIPPNNYHLFFGGKQLDYGRTLRDYEIHEESTLDGVRIKEENKHIYVKTLIGETINLYVDPDCTIKMIKEQIQDIIGINPGQYKLIIAGKELKDHLPLSYYGLKEENTFYLIDRSLGNYSIGIIVPSTQKSFVLNEKIVDKWHLKEIVKEETGIPCDDQQIVSQGKILDRIDKDHHYLLIFQKSEKIRPYIICLSEPDYLLNLLCVFYENLKDIKYLKLFIQKNRHIPQTHIRIYRKFHALSPHEQIQDLKFENGEILQFKITSRMTKIKYDNTNFS